MDTPRRHVTAKAIAILAVLLTAGWLLPDLVRGAVECDGIWWTKVIREILWVAAPIVAAVYWVTNFHHWPYRVTIPLAVLIAVPFLLLAADGAAGVWTVQCFSGPLPSPEATAGF